MDAIIQNINLPDNVGFALYQSNNSDYSSTCGTVSIYCSINHVGWLVGYMPCFMFAWWNKCILQVYHCVFYVIDLFFFL